MLLLQEFNIKIKDNKGSKNIVADHLLRLKLEQEDNKEEEPIQELFPNEMLLVILSLNAPWFADIANLISSAKFPEEINSHQ